MSSRIRKGDEVVVLSGRDKGRRGRVVERVSDSHVRVEGVNLVKKHVKPNPMKGVTGGIEEKVMPIHQSNVAIFNAETGKADRIGIKVVELPEGARKRYSRVRVFRSSGKEIKTA